MKISPALSFSLLVCLLCFALGGCATPPPTLDMPPVGAITLLPTETNLGSEEEILAEVKNAPPPEIISLALVQVRKKYPELEVENLELRSFSYDYDNFRIGPRPPMPGETVIVSFLDRSSFQLTGEDGDDVLSQHQVYRVEYDIIRSDGRQGIFIRSDTSKSRTSKRWLEKQANQ